MAGVEVAIPILREPDEQKRVSFVLLASQARTTTLS